MSGYKWYLREQDAFVSAQGDLMIYRNYEARDTKLMRLCQLCGFPAPWARFDLTGWGLCSDCEQPEK